MADEWNIPPWQVEEECSTYWYKNYLSWKSAVKLEQERRTKKDG